MRTLTEDKEREGGNIPLSASFAPQNSLEAQPLHAREACEGRGEGRRAGVADGVVTVARGEGGEAEFVFLRARCSALLCAGSVPVRRRWELCGRGFGLGVLLPLACVVQLFCVAREGFELI